MVFLIVLAALVVWAASATVYVVIRDGYRPVDTRPLAARSATDSEPHTA